MGINEFIHRFQLKQYHVIHNHICFVFSNNLSMIIDKNIPLPRNGKSHFKQQNLQRSFVNLLKRTQSPIPYELEKTPQ